MKSKDKILEELEPLINRWSKRDNWMRAVGIQETLTHGLANMQGLSDWRVSLAYFRHEDSIGSFLHLYYNLVTDGISLFRINVPVPFEKEDLKWLDMHNYKLDPSYAKRLNLRIEDWIYDEGTV